jgi:hypothetical protein
MNNPLFENMLSQYSPTTKDDYTNALHEVMQQITLRIVPAGQVSAHLSKTLQKWIFGQRIIFCNWLTELISARKRFQH